MEATIAHLKLEHDENGDLIFKDFSVDALKTLIFHPEITSDDFRRIVMRYAEKIDLMETGFLMYRFLETRKTCGEGKGVPLSEFKKRMRKAIAGRQANALQGHS